MQAQHSPRPIFTLLLAGAVLFGGVIGMGGTLAATSHNDAPTQKVAALASTGCDSSNAQVSFTTVNANDPDANGKTPSHHDVVLNGKTVGSIDTDNPSDVQILKQTNCNAYLTVLPDGVGGYINYAIEPLAFYKLSLQDGTLTKLAAQTFDGAVTDVSPDEKNYAGMSIGEGPMGTSATVYVTNIATGEVKEFSKEFSLADAVNAAGDAMFSPDGSKVAFSVAANNPDAEASQVYVLDLTTGAFTPFGDKVVGQVEHVTGWVGNITPKVQF